MYIHYVWFNLCLNQSTLLWVAKQATRDLATATQFLSISWPTWVLDKMSRSAQLRGRAKPTIDDVLLTKRLSSEAPLEKTMYDCDAWVRTIWCVLLRRLLLWIVQICLAGALSARHFSRAYASTLAHPQLEENMRTILWYWYIHTYVFDSPDFYAINEASPLKPTLRAIDV